MSKARQLADLGNQVDDGAITGSNMVINGAMNVAQRSSSVTGNGSSGYLTCDRWKVSGGMGTRTVTQQADAPEGFYNSYKIEITTAETSPSAGTSLAFEQRMEGQNLQMLKKGTSNALPITISFWVKSNKTGTYILEIDDNDNSRNINKSYTVSSSGVWEYKTITFEGDTTGSLDNDNAHSLRLFFWLDAGSNFRGGTLATSWESTTNANRADGNVTFADTVGNTWQITGVCLNVGDSAIDFPHERYGDTLAKCQRYFEKSFSSSVTPAAQVSTADRTVVTAFTSSAAGLSITYNTTKRAAPSVTIYRGVATGSGSASGSGNIFTGSTWVERTYTGANSTDKWTSINFSGSFTSGNSYICDFNYTLDAEL